jgi:hypothetical protein
MGATVMEALIKDVQSGLLAYAKNNDLELRQLLEPGSDHYNRAMSIIYEAIAARERTSKTTANEILGSAILNVFQRSAGLPVEPETEQPAESESTEVTAPPAGPVPEPVPEPQPPPRRPL